MAVENMVCHHHHYHTVLLKSVEPLWTLPLLLSVTGFSNYTVILHNYSSCNSDKHQLQANFHWLYGHIETHLQNSFRTGDPGPVIFWLTIIFSNNFQMRHLNQYLYVCKLISLKILHNIWLIQKWVGNSENEIHHKKIETNLVTKTYLDI